MLSATHFYVASYQYFSIFGDFCCLGGVKFLS